MTHANKWPWICDPLSFRSKTRFSFVELLESKFHIGGKTRQENTTGASMKLGQKPGTHTVSKSAYVKALARCVFWWMDSRCPIWRHFHA